MLRRMSRPAARIYTDQPLQEGRPVTLADGQAHYLLHVMRAGVGTVLRLFNGRDGEWQARITDTRKRELTAEPVALLHAQRTTPAMTVCFAPPRGGRIDTIIEKATELGAAVLQPVRTQHSVVDKVNEEKWKTTVREAAEQSERLDLPAIRPLVSLPQLLGGWPAGVPLVYGDESGGSGRIALDGAPAAWGVLVGPEGGFSAEEHALIRRIPAAQGVALGPRILRVDTAAIALCTLTQSAWGDWHERPHFGTQP